ncbi:MAG TPA: prepilin-type N-terminal cleavage/methylation domain-containing protein, partial [Prochlorococcaceae cyanobacterium Fu_MAG_50]|nr:prepilin-type N-terminal cleavage/methylation domain-containing protein [Prochlorococcaceae cyanobacterium Fu_MAG_50]
MATTNILNRIRQASTGKGAAAGFTLVEVLIAGVLLASMMAAVGRFSVSALTASSNQAERTHIEATINENMQLLHQADAQLTLESIPEADRAAAC